MLRFLAIFPLLCLDVDGRTVLVFFVYLKFLIKWQFDSCNSILYALYN